MAASSQKFLVETSAVLPAIGFSAQSHNEYFRQLVGAANLASSVYVRMEVIRKWLCEAIEFAELAEQCSTVSDAFHFWSQKYGRKPKIASDIAAWLLGENGEIRNDQVHEFAVAVCEKALDVLMAFDSVLHSSTTNKCGCQIGGKKLEFDRGNLIRELSDFRKSFLRDIVDCDVNVFLQFGNPKGRSQKLLACQAVAADHKIAGPLLDVTAKGSVVCSTCKTIGDQIIALEQPNGLTLLHVDKSFDKLCSCTDRDHLRIASMASFSPTAKRL